MVIFLLVLMIFYDIPDDLPTLPAPLKNKEFLAQHQENAKIS